MTRTKTYLLTAVSALLFLFLSWAFADGLFNVRHPRHQRHLAARVYLQRKSQPLRLAFSFPCPPSNCSYIYLLGSS